MNSPYSPEQQANIKAIKPESVEEFLARGGRISTVRKPTKKANKIDAQTLLDAAIGTPQEAEVIAFLASQGIEVE